LQEKRDGAREKEAVKEGKKVEVLKVYRFYHTLLFMQDREEAAQASKLEASTDIMDADGTPRLGVSGRISAGGVSSSSALPDSNAPSPREPSRTSLMPIAWTAFSLWVDRQWDCATNYKFKSACNALVRALQRWRSNKQKESQLKRLQCITLYQVFVWMWPDMKFCNFSNMLIHVCHHELEKIRVRTPDVLPAADRRQLQEIFKRLDTNKKGYCTADDLAGGSVQTIKAKLNNLVDADTVRTVCGDGDITEHQFLAVMIQDGICAYERSVTAYSDGQHICLIHKDVSGFRGWFLQTAPENEFRQRKLIDCIEDEILFWRHLDRTRHKYGAFSPCSETRDSLPSSGGGGVEHRWDAVVLTAR